MAVLESAKRLNAIVDHGNQSKTGRSPLILLPGVGGDAHLFARQRAAFPELVVPSWIEPERNESLVDYAARFAKVIDPGQACFIGGMSFGGVVAIEVATHLLTRECYLFGSVRSPREIPKRLRFFTYFTDLIMIPKWLSPLALRIGGRRLSPAIRGTLHKLKDADGRFLRWASKALLKWQPSAGVQQLRIVQIHGDRDRVFPVRRVTADKVVAGAGHMVSMTRSKEVNQFLRERMSSAPG